MEDDSYYAASMLPVLRLGRILKIFRSTSLLHFMNFLYTPKISTRILLWSLLLVDVLSRRRSSRTVNVGGSPSPFVYSKSFSHKTCRSLVVSVDRIIAISRPMRCPWIAVISQ